MGTGTRLLSWLPNIETADRSGREPELGRATVALLGAARVVTFTGPAGVGKSWTARELKRRLVTGSGWRAVTVRVDCARGFSELLAVLAERLGMPATGGALRDRLAVALQDGPQLLVLDGCEPLAGSPHPVEQLLGLAPRLHVVATSLRPLGVPGEHVIGLDPFPVPPPAAGPEALHDSAAVRLFCRTAATTGDGFDPEAADLAAIAELCRRVHGLPLAIQIMASRAGVESPAAMVEALDSGHEFTYQHTGGYDDPRHLSLGAALGWSYSMLDVRAAHLLRHMAVFSAPATLGMLTGVTGDAPDGEQPDVARALSTLVEHRLVQPHPGPGEPAYTLVELVRDFAVGRLVDEGEHAAAEDAHAGAVVDFALSRSEAVEISEDDVAPAELQRAEPDLRGVMRRLLGRGDVEQGLALASALAPFVLRRGYDGFVQPALGSLLRRAASAEVDPALVARAELWRARLMAHFEGPDAVDDVRRALTSGLDRARRSGDEQTVLLGLAVQMQTLPATGDLDAARAAAKEGVVLAEANGDARWSARFYAWAGMVAYQAGHSAEAFQLALRGVRRVETSGDPRAQILLTLLLTGLPEHEAEPLLARLPSTDELLDTARRLHDARYEPFLLRSAAAAALRSGDLRTAAARCGECLRLAHRQASWQVLPFAVLLLGLVAAERGDLPAAARFHGMVRRRLHVLQPATPPGWLEAYVDRMRQLRDRLAEEAFEAEARQGELDMHANALRGVLAYADKAAGAPANPRPSRRDPDHLTARELEVLEELITGATNKEISLRLGMSPKTVMHHSGAIYRKLGVRSRAEATAWAFRHGLAD